MLIVSIVMVSAFQALSSVWIAKVKLIEQTEIEKQAYFASERFFEMIKKGGTIDYEEYWNRYSDTPSYSSGHFDSISWFGNFGDLYHCVSGSWLALKMWTGWCLNNSPTQENNMGIDYTWAEQRYGQYALQFIDRNSDFDGDGWDEDWAAGILGDDDDMFIGVWPEAFVGSSDLNKVWELYFINAQGNQRTYFRWNVGLDSGSNTTVCSGWESMAWNDCLGTIEFLKLTGKDYGLDGTLSWPPDADGSQSDGVIDTWLIHDDFNPSGTDVLAGSNAIDYWESIFPDSMHVSDVEFYVYPNKSLEHSWRDDDESIFIAPYVQIKMTLQPSAKTKRKIIGKAPVVHIATTIQLSSLDLK